MKKLTKITLKSGAEEAWIDLNSVDAVMKSVSHDYAWIVSINHTHVQVQREEAMRIINMINGDEN